MEKNTKILHDYVAVECTRCHTQFAVVRGSTVCPPHDCDMLFENWVHRNVQHWTPDAVYQEGDQVIWRDRLVTLGPLVGDLGAKD